MNRMNLICLGVKNLKQARDFYHGVRIVKPPQEVFWGGYSGYFQDPEGYYWEILYAKGYQFDDQDMLVIE
ncbi:MAG: hypothetical protein PHO09_02815 [Sphaerochaeta sp.]|nr:hypothetical protein [Sphaerochaeta sp.]